MPVTFILGRAGTGKTRHCLDALLAELEKPNESRRLLLLVPEQAGFQMERTLAVRAPRHGYWRAEVLSFSRLARRVFEEVGREPDTLRATARALALRCVVEGDEDVLRAFGPAARTVGFFAQLDRLIEELLAENVTPEQVGQAESRIEDSAARRRVGAIARVYQDYLDWLGPERIDPVLRLAALRERLAGAEWLGETSVWVDGFAWFSGQELETLVTLAREVRNVEITLLLDPAARAVRDVRRPPDLLNLFHRTESTYQRLVQRLTGEGVELCPPMVLQPSIVPRFAQAADLARLEAGLATPIGAVSIMRREAGGAGLGGPVLQVSQRPDHDVPPTEQVRVLECETHRDELRAAARFIREQVRLSRGALRFRDFAVIARGLEPFVELVADVFAEYELPYFLDRRRSLGVHALTRFVQALLETVATDFSTTSAARLLRCGLLPLSREQAETLENEIVANEVRGFAIWRRQRWTFERGNALSQTEAEVLDEARLRIADALEPFVQLAQADTPTSGATWASTLHETLASLQVPARLTSWIEQSRQTRDHETAETHRLAWDALRDVLEDLHDVLGERPLELADLTVVIGSALGELTVGLAPPTLDQVLVSSIERSRHPEIRYAWVFAFNEGIFPARPGDDTLLSTADREWLIQAGLSAPRPRRDDAFAERLLAYIALTRPSHGLTISYAKAGDDGEPRSPSPLFSEVRQVLPELEIERAAEDQPPACLSEFARDYLRIRASEPRSAVIWRRYERLREELHASPALSVNLERLLRGVDYANSPEPVPGYSRAADVAWSGSPTELDKYLQCPFRHFAQYGLSLSTQRGPAPAALELGSQAHEILAAVTEQAIADPRPVNTLPDEQWLALLDDAIREFAAKQPADLAKRRPRAAFLGDALRPFLAELVLAHAERWRRGVFEPLACERRFRRDDQDSLDALELKTADGQYVRLHGFIDRIDRCEHEGRTYLLVYDYKSTPKRVNDVYLTQDRLQLFTYLLAVEQALATGEDAQLAGVLLAPLFPQPRAAEAKTAEEWSESELRMHLYRPRGLFVEDIARLLDRNLDQSSSPVVAMKLKKDGGFNRSASRDVIDADELHKRLRLAEQTILHAAEGIVKGCIDIAPLVEKKVLACGTCDFAALCRFEPVFNRPRVAENALPVLSAANDSGGVK